MTTHDDMHRQEGDHREFVVTSSRGGVYQCWGEADAKIIAGSSGSYTATGRTIDPDDPRRTFDEEVTELDRAVRQIRADLERIRRGFLGEG